MVKMFDPVHNTTLCSQFVIDLFCFLIWSSFLPYMAMFDLVFVAIYGGV